MYILTISFEKLLNKPYLRYTARKNNLVDLNEIETNVKNYIVQNDLDLTKAGVNVVCLSIDDFTFRNLNSIEVEYLINRDKILF